MPSVRILNVDRVVPAAQSYPPPGDTVPLSFFDTYWISLPPIQRLFLYSDHHSDHPIPFPASLKSSLSQTLSQFHPLAGKLTHLPSSGDVIIDCSPSAVGVDFVEAECDADIQRLAGDPIHDVELFAGLVPELDVRVLPAPVMAVQATAFAGGGVAVGISVHHVATDGVAMWLFLEAWAAACKGGGTRSTSTTTPVHDRAVIGHPGGDEIARRFLKESAPGLPIVSVTPPLVALEARLRLQRRTFTLSSSTVQSLKRRIIKQSNGPDSPSAFVAISSHAWVSLAIATAQIHPSDAAAAVVFLADCRSRLDPPIAASYTGNCVRPCHATATWRELRGDRGLARASEEIARAAREATREPLKGCGEWRSELIGLAESDPVLVGGSPRFRVYDTDFGFGRPSRVELLSMDKEGVVVYVGGREDGEVQVSVALDPGRMDVFAQLFVGGFGD